MKINKKNPFHWLSLFWVGMLLVLFLPLRLMRRTTKKRTVILYGHKLHGNLNAIYEYSLKHKERIHNFQIFSLTMDLQYYREINNKPNILFALHPFHLKKIVLADCIISDHGLHSLKLLLKLTNITFIDVWHGIPFKGFIPADFATQHQYDEVWVSSKHLQSLYCDTFGFQKNRVQVTGYGRTDLIRNYHTYKNQIRAKLNIPNNKKVILFAPTWKQDTKNREEIPFNLTQEYFLNSLEDFAVKNNACLIIRYHLNSNQGGSFDNQNILHLPLQKHPNSEEIIAVTDCLITDWSSIAFDMMVLDKPIIFLDVPSPFKNGFSLPPDYRVGDRIRNLPQLIASLTEACLSEDHYMEKHKKEYQRIKKIVYDNTTDGKATERYVERLEILLKNE
ncbi:MAG: CDP-glycerol--glycerophosphate glycerophosphotransferase [Candidatus Electrothrix sp. AW5]|nr:CDP-glycerol--glycerophosphate glycerophosphotransferase [Candidatus Electrothrix gigas]